MKRPKDILTLTILILQTILLSSASNNHILNANSFNKEKNNGLFPRDVSYPDIPPRPTLSELSKTIELNYDLNHKYKFSNGFVQDDRDVKKNK